MVNQRATKQHHRWTMPEHCYFCCLESLQNALHFLHDWSGLTAYQYTADQVIKHNLQNNNNKSRNKSKLKIHHASHFSDWKGKITSVSQWITQCPMPTVTSKAMYSSSTNLPWFLHFRGAASNHGHFLDSCSMMPGMMLTQILHSGNKGKWK